jgi:hypothetical protein
MREEEEEEETKMMDGNKKKQKRSAGEHEKMKSSRRRTKEEGESRDSSVTEELGFDSWHGQEIQRSDRPCGPSSLLYNGHPGTFPRRESGRGANLTTHLHSLRG